MPFARECAAWARPSHPEDVEGAPIGDALARCTDRFATRWWHWFFLAQPDRPERAINADPDAWYGGSAAAMGERAYAEYRRAIHDPATVYAMLEDYRAGLGVDRAHDEADRAAGRRLRCPVLVLWSSRDDLEDLYGNPLEVWAAWAEDLRGRSIQSGHHMAEDAPGELASALAEFIVGRDVEDVSPPAASSPGPAGPARGRIPATMKSSSTAPTRRSSSPIWPATARAASDTSEPTVK